MSSIRTLKLVRSVFTQCDDTCIRLMRLIRLLRSFVAISRMDHPNQDASDG